MESERISHYELVRRIGRGGMGEVWEATDLKLRRRVALKFLSPELTAEPQALVRFEREALAAAELNHPHIATVYAFEPDGERPFIAMELLAGPSLRERLEGGPLPVAEAMAIARDVATALAYAHRHGTSHRDIKPENLMFDEHGAIRVMDFGLARASMASRLTVTGTHLGTPAYMSPESIRGETGPESDVFAMGLVLWEMLAGRRAYPGENAMAVMFQIANEAPPSLRELRPDVPEVAEQLIERMLAKDASLRIGAADAARELASLTGVSADTVSAAFEGSYHATERRGARILFGGLAVVVILGVAGVTFMASGAARRKDEAARLADQGSAALRDGHGDEARALFTRALSRNPKNDAALLNLALIAVNEKRFLIADSLARAALRHFPRDRAVRAAAFRALGESSLGQHTYGEAIDNFQSALAVDSSVAVAYNNLAWTLIQDRQASAGLSVLERGIRRFPGEPSLHKNAGLALLQLGDPVRALARLERAVALDSTLAEAVELRDRARREAAVSP